VAHRVTADTAKSRYVVGFDLGTTNSAVTYVDAQEEPWRVRTFAVPQLVAPGQVEARQTIPSFHYQPAPGELPEGGSVGRPATTGGAEGDSPIFVGRKSGQSPERKSGQSPDQPPHIVGFFARDHGAMVPGRLISSAKSWLCHSGVDRTAGLLPWHGAADVQRLSPVEVSARYLAHARDAWNAQFPRHPLAEQDFVLTLPASFDEVARELTVKAAALAGLARVVLIEEPQAAFYAWIDAHRSDWERLVEPGQKILVCDVGGGTSDFTLIRVRRGEGGKVQFHRVAVGDHLILGGDNLDLALAHHLERRLLGEGEDEGRGARGEGRGTGEACDEGDSPVFAERKLGQSPERLEPRQWAILVQRCRQLKETLLGADAPERITLSLPWSGSRLIGGARQIEVTREEVHEVLVEGFFPLVPLDARPARRGSGFQEFGLPFAPDPAVTRYLAAFLTAHRHVAMDEPGIRADHDPARPDIVLLNGGLFESPVLAARMIEALVHWFGGGGWRPIVLENQRLDLAVARGAAYYGMVRRGQGVRIAAGLARTYYIGVEGPCTPHAPREGTVEPPGADETAEAAGAAPEAAVAGQALCLVPAGVEPGQDVDLTQRRFDLRVSEPVEFPLYVSSTRLTDRPGELAPLDREQLTPLPPIRTVLRTRKKGAAETVSVNLHARLTEIGTLDLWCSESEGKRSWRLVFDVRSATETDVAAHESAAESEGFVDEATWLACRAAIDRTFGPGADEKPDGLAKRLAAASGMSRNLWPTSLCRRIWDALMDVESGRRASPLAEARWLNLLGFALRPGYGLAVDDWRVAETWRVVQGKLVHPTAACRVEGWILWRRIGGGLAAGQQQALAEPLLGPMRGLCRLAVEGKGRGGDFGFSPHETAEMWRLLGSLELLPVALKIELGDMLLDLLPKRKMESVRPAMVWAVGRIGARVPLVGPLNTVVPAETAAAWVRRLMENFAGDPVGPLAVMQLARHTGDRYRDIPEKLRAAALGWLARESAPAHFVELVRAGGRLDREEQGLVFGESVPKGLRLG
jgi:molecular chaperone DnaK (HSP70)